MTEREQHLDTLTTAEFLAEMDKNKTGKWLPPDFTETAQGGEVSVEYMKGAMDRALKTKVNNMLRRMRRAT